MWDVSSVTSNIILILHFVASYIHQSIVSKSTRILHVLVLSEMHDVVLCISGTIQKFVIMLYLVQISDTQIKPIKDNRFVSQIFVDGLRVINLFNCI